MRWGFPKRKWVEENIKGFLEGGINFEERYDIAKEDTDETSYGQDGSESEQDQEEEESDQDQEEEGTVRVQAPDPEWFGHIVWA